jgi:hypothetical protein
LEYWWGFLTREKVVKLLTFIDGGSQASLAKPAEPRTRQRTPAKPRRLLADWDFCEQKSGSSFL